jgi:hypothetical protein
MLIANPPLLQGRNQPPWNGPPATAEGPPLRRKTQSGHLSTPADPPPQAPSRSARPQRPPGWPPCGRAEPLAALAFPLAVFAKLPQPLPREAAKRSAEGPPERLPGEGRESRGQRPLAARSAERHGPGSGRCYALTHDGLSDLVRARVSRRRAVRRRTPAARGRAVPGGQRGTVGERSEAARAG